MPHPHMVTGSTHPRPSGGAGMVVVGGGVPPRGVRLRGTRAFTRASIFLLQKIVTLQKGTQVQLSLALHLSRERG